jgi:hypothetical protein
MSGRLIHGLLFMDGMSQHDGMDLALTLLVGMISMVRKIDDTVARLNDSFSGAS